MEDKRKKHIEQIPKQRAFTLNVILVCGILIFLYGLYSKLFDNDKRPHLFFDGENYHTGVIDGLYFVVVGFVICVFPLYHFIKGNHRVK